MEGVSAEEDNYIKQHIDKYSRKFELPNSIFIDAKLHPIKKDHIIVLSRNVFPQHEKIEYLYMNNDPNYAEATQIDIINHPYFPEALLEGEKSDNPNISQEAKEDDTQNNFVISKMNSGVAHSSEETKYQNKEEEKAETVPHSSLDTPESKTR